MAAKLTHRRHRLSARKVAALLQGSALPARNGLVDPRRRRRSNGYRSHPWKAQLHDLAVQTGLRIFVCHFPPGTSKWNKIENRMFCHITQNWRGRPLVSHEVIIQLIGNTAAQTGLRINAGLDKGRYPIGLRVSRAELSRLRIEPATFHGDWNYAIHPPASRT